MSVYQSRLKDKKAEKALEDIKRQQGQILSTVSAQGTASRLQASHNHEEAKSDREKNAAAAAARANQHAAESKERDEDLKATVCKSERQLRDELNRLTDAVMTLTAQKASKPQIQEEEKDPLASLSAPNAPDSPLVRKPPASAKPSAKTPASKLSALSKENNDPEKNVLRDELAATKKELQVSKQQKSQLAQRNRELEEDRRRRDANGSDIMDQIPAKTILSPKAASRNNAARGGHADRIRHGASVAEKNRRKKQESTISATPARPVRRSTRSQANRKVAQ